MDLLLKPIIFTFIHHIHLLNTPDGSNTHTRRADHTSFIPISARTDVYKYSFFPRRPTLLDWNTVC